MGYGNGIGDSESELDEELKKELKEIGLKLLRRDYSTDGQLINLLRVLNPFCFLFLLGVYSIVFLERLDFYAVIRYFVDGLELFFLM